MASKRNIYENTVPAMIIPDHFFCNQSSKIAVIYDEPIGEDDDVVMLKFPGNLSGSASKEVEPKRIGNRTLVFDTPVYSSSRGLVEVLPLLSLPGGEVAQLAHFKLSLKHPIRNVMELCLSLSTNDAILPVLLSLMVHSQSDSSKEYFQDPHVDRVMATLVGSRAPGDGTCIQDIVLPNKRWRRLNLAEFARRFQLTEMEKQAYNLNQQRSKWVSKPRKSPKRTKTILHSQTIDSVGNLEDDDDSGVSERLHHHRSSSTSDITKIDQQNQRDSGVSDDLDTVQKMIKSAKSHCQVIKDFTPGYNEASCIPLRMNKKVYVVQETNTDWWYGVCDDQCGYFPPANVKPMSEGSGKIRRKTVGESLQHQSNEMGGSIGGESASSRQKYGFLSPPATTASEINVSGPTESPLVGLHHHLKENHLFNKSNMNKRDVEDHRSGFQSDSEILEDSLMSSNSTVRKFSGPSKKDQQRMAFIIPLKSNTSPVSHQPLSSCHGHSTKRTGDDVPSSDSDSYEDVMSGSDDDEVVKSQWTARKKSPPRAAPNNSSTAERRAPKKPFPLPYIRPMTSPSVSDQPLSAWEMPSDRKESKSSVDSVYDDTVMPASAYANITDAFEMVDDHIYDVADESFSSTSASVINQMTATDAHVRAAAHMASVNNHKQAQQVGCQNPTNDPLGLRSGRRSRNHSTKDTDAADNNQRDMMENENMILGTFSCVPPRNVPRANVSPVLHSSTSHDSSVIQTKRTGALSPPHLRAHTVVPKAKEYPPTLPAKQFAIPMLPPKEKHLPTIPPKSPKGTPPTPPSKASKPVTSPKRVVPALPPKEVPPPWTIPADAPSLPPKISSQSMSVAMYPKPVKQLPTVPIPPPKPAKQDCPALPPKCGMAHPQTQCPFENNNGHQEHSGFGRHHAPSMSLAMLLQTTQQGNPISKRRYNTEV